jgi:hypothetical protein
MLVTFIARLFFYMVDINAKTFYEKIHANVTKVQSKKKKSYKRDVRRPVPGWGNTEVAPPVVSFGTGNTEVAPPVRGLAKLAGGTRSVASEEKAGDRADYICPES